MNIVWFKRDLRLEDHEALAQAAKHRPVLPLYILEPVLWQQPDMSHRHYLFLQECLSELNQDLEKMGQRLIIKVGNAVDVLEDIYQRQMITSLWLHQETWNGWTYECDKAVKRWCKLRNITWHEKVQNGVVRRLVNRDGWAARWYNQMKQPLIDKPLTLQAIDEPTDALPSYLELGLNEDGASDLQKGGRIKGLKVLHSFLYERAEGYTKEMSSPVTAFKNC